VLQRTVVTARLGRRAGRHGTLWGDAFQVRHRDLVVREITDDPQAELVKLDEAIDTARHQLETLQVQLHGQAGADKAAILAAHQEILDDPELRDSVRSAILKGNSTAFAWQQAITTQASQLASCTTSCWPPVRPTCATSASACS